MRRRILPLLLFLLVGLLTNVLVALALSVFVDVQQGPQSQAESLVDDERWSVIRWDRAGAARIRSVRVRGLSWSPQQAAGEPDTATPGDQVTAWASQAPDAGTEWLVLRYAKAVTPRELDVYESCAPGALVRVTAVTAAGEEVEAWSGTDPSASGAGPHTTGGIAISKVPLKVNFATDRIKIYLACDKVPNWNEVDAVGLIGDGGDLQWARHVQASSTYASNSAAQAGASGNPALLTAGWTDLGHSREAFTSGVANREERSLDARGWPLLTLRSDIDLLAPAKPTRGTNAYRALTNPTLQVNGSPVSSYTFTGAVALTTPATADARAPLPTHPIWAGLVVNTLFYATIWLALWATFTIPRRFVRDLARVRRGACIACGYDLGFDFIHGCPECGWRRDATNVERAPRDEAMIR